MFGELIDKHSASYREHLLDLLLRREWTIARLCRGIDAVQEELPTVLEPAVRMRRRELETARTRLAERQEREELIQRRQELAVLRTQVQNLEAGTRARERHRRLEDASWARGRPIAALDRERHRAVERIEGLQQSWSWRLTSPLRRMYEWLRFR